MAKKPLKFRVRQEDKAPMPISPTAKEITRRDLEARIRALLDAGTVLTLKDSGGVRPVNVSGFAEDWASVWFDASPDFSNRVSYSFSWPTVLRCLEAGTPLRI